MSMLRRMVVNRLETGPDGTVRQKEPPRPFMPRPLMPGRRSLRELLDEDDLDGADFNDVPAAEWRVIREQPDDSDFASALADRIMQEYIDDALRYDEIRASQDEEVLHGRTGNT